MKIKIQSKTGLKVISINRRKAICEKCLNCSTWVPSEISNCTFTDCALYPFCSGQGYQNAKAKAKAIKPFCLQCGGVNPGEISKCTCPDCPLSAYRNSQVDKSIEI